MIINMYQQTPSGFPYFLSSYSNKINVIFNLVTIIFYALLSPFWKFFKKKRNPLVVCTATHALFKLLNN